MKFLSGNMDKHRSQTPQGPEGKPDGTLLVAGTAKAGPSTKQPSRVQPTQQGSGTTKVGPPSSTSGGKAAKSTLTSANTHRHGGGAAKAAPPHTKRQSVGGRGETGKPEEPRPSTSTAFFTGSVPPQGGAKPKGAILDVARAPGQPGTRTAEEVAALQRFDEAWTLVDRRRAKGKPGKSAGGASGAGSSQPGGEPEPKRKSKRQRQRQKKRAMEAEAAKRAATAQADEPKSKGSVKFAKGAASGQGNQAASRTQRGKTKAKGKAGGGSTSQAPAKRARLDDTQSPRGDPKKPKLVDGTQVPYAEAVRSDLLVAVTTVTGEPLTAQAAEEIQVLLQERLLKDAIDATNDEPVNPVFQGKPTYANGALKLWCEDHDTVAYLTRIVSEFTLSTGTRLMVKRQCDLVRLVRCGVLLPGKQPDIWIVGRALRFQNKWARVDSWILHKVDRQDGNTFLIFSAPEDVVQTLIDRERRLCYLLGSVYVKFQGPKGKFTEHLPTEQDDRMGDASGGGQARGEGSGAIPAIPEPPPTMQSSPKSQAEEAVDEEELLRESEEGACAAGLGNLAIGGTGTEEEMEVLSEDGLPSSSVL